MKFNPDEQGMKTMAEIGTRYQHYTELIDLWSDGIETLRGIISRFDSTADKANLIKLENARDLLQKRIDILTDSDAGTRLYGTLARQIDEIEPHKTALLTGGNDDDPTEYSTK